MQKKYILWFRQLGKKDVPLVGGKNASLGEMYSRLSKKGIKVPNGFVLTATAYWHFLKVNKIDKGLKEVFVDFNPKSIRSLQETSKKARAMILDAEFPDDLKKEIVVNYEKLSQEYGEKNVSVAVRSSATAEDLPSIAGEEMVLVRVNNDITYLPVQKLFAKINQLGDHVPNIYIPTLVGINKIKWAKVQEIYRHPVSTKKLYKITTKSGRQITVTANHSLITLDPDNLTAKVVSIKDIKNNNRLPVIKRLPNVNCGAKVLSVNDLLQSSHNITIYQGRVKFNHRNTIGQQYGLPPFIEIDKDLAYYLGIYLAEGSIYKNKAIDVSCDSPEVLERVRSFYQSLGSYKGDKVIEDRKVRVNNAVMACFLQKLTGEPVLAKKGKGRGCRAKYVPEFMFSQPPEIIGEFLKGLFDGDGWVTDNEIGYSSTSEKLIGGVGYLLNMLDLPFYIVKKAERSGMDIIIQLKAAQQFKDKVNFSVRSRKEKLEKVIEDYNQRSKHHDFIDTFPPSKGVNQIMEKYLKPTFPVEKTEVFVCPNCEEDMIGGGTYPDYNDENIRINRYSCKSCGYNASERSGNALWSRVVNRYVYYDKLGRFKMGTIPWNKGNRQALLTYGALHLAKVAKKLNSKELLQLVDSDVVWDRVVRIESVGYSGYVYDFVVPGVENFSAGFGGVITHNTASFAGQHETFLNVRGEGDLLRAVKKCIASLFTSRAIIYRQEKGFNHFKIALSVGVQKMVRSDLASSGVIFTLDTETGFRNVVLINSIYGVGEMIVKGKITPDEFFVFKPTLRLAPLAQCKPYKPIIVKNLGRKNKKYVYRPGGGLKEVVVPSQKQLKFSLTDSEVLQLARWAVVIEEHYKIPQDIEWAKDGKTGELFIVQSRPETVHTQDTSVTYQEYELKTAKAPALTGIAIGNKIGVGKVRVIPDVSKISNFKKGEVLVTRMTDPDWVSIFPMASGIITEEGGKTCHAAIVSRELGTPAIVAVKGATKALKNGQEITVDCSQGSQGRVFRGRLPFQVKKYNLKKLPKPKTKIMVNIGAPEIAFKTSFLPNDGVGLAREEFVIAEKIRIHPLALYHYNKLKTNPFAVILSEAKNLSNKEKFAKIIKQIDEITVEHKDKKEYFVKELAEGIAQIAAAFWPKPVIVRFSDFKTNEYRQLVGGELFEPQEENPMLGWRGASRYYHPDFQPAFLMECEAIKRARDIFGLKNIRLMVPFCRTVEEGRKVLALMKKAGLASGRDGLEIYVMCEIPSNVILAEQFLKIFDGMSIGSNDLAQLVLGIDRDNASLQFIADERNEAVKKMISRVIKLCREKKKYCGICGQAPSDFPDFAEFLIREGIESISLNPDSVIKTIIKLSKSQAPT